MLTADEVVIFPAASRATAVMLWAPLVTLVVFHIRSYGAVVSSAPTALPSTLNCTPETATLSEAFAASVIPPEYVAPAEGLVIETLGAVVSAVTIALAGL